MCVEGVELFGFHGDSVAKGVYYSEVALSHRHVSSRCARDDAISGFSETVNKRPCTGPAGRPRLHERPNPIVFALGIIT